MLNPSIDSLLEKIDSKYTLVTVAAKRAREMQIADNVLLKSPVSYKCVGKALEEIDAEVLNYVLSKRKYLSKILFDNENIDFILFYVTVTTYLQVGCYFFTIELKRNRFLLNEILA